MNKIQHRFNNVVFQAYLRNDVDLSVFNEIFKYREYKACEDFLKAAKYPVLDIGAHAGFFSIYSYCFNKNIKIYAVEPEKENLNILSLNRQENNIENIKIIEGAVGISDRDGELILSEDSINHYVKPINYNIDAKDLRKYENKQKIKIFTLKYFFERNKIDRISLIKMDIEGGEYEIIEKIDKEIFSKIDAFILEYHLLKDGKDEKYLENIFRENGFSVQIFPSRFDKGMGFIFARNKISK